MLGIIGAMEMEVNALLARMDVQEDAVIGFSHYYAGALFGVPVCLAKCGVGKVHGALCAQGMILRYAPEAILNIGVAGALREGIRVGDLVIAGSAVQHDMDTTPVGDPPGLISGINRVHLPCAENLTALLFQAAKGAGLSAFAGAIATGDQFIVGTEKKDALSAFFDAAACDMEGAAIAQACYEMDVPYAACRAISDTRRGDAGEYMEKAALACRAEEKLLSILLPLYKNAKERDENG